jgi:hypothetical protein
MKTLILAVIAVVGLGLGAANAQSFAHSAPPSQQTDSE